MTATTKNLTPLHPNSLAGSIYVRLLRSDFFSEEMGFEALVEEVEEFLVSDNKWNPYALNPFQKEYLRERAPRIARRIDAWHNAARAAVADETADEAASQIIAQMDAEQRAAFTVNDWRDAVSGLVAAGWPHLGGGEVLDAVVHALAGDVIVQVDEENDGEDFWTEIGASGHPIAKRFAVGNAWCLRASDWETARAFLSTLDGWTGGPGHAPHPLLTR